MYRITLVGGMDIAVVDEPYYIKVGNSGSFCPAKNREDALGVAVNGTPYALLGVEGIEAPVVVINKIDGGFFALQTAENAAKIDYLSAMTGIEIPTEEAPIEDNETEGE